ncbi:MAG: autoinducer 2-degrading protein, partial [Gammaproteobacteria bacterium]
KPEFVDKFVERVKKQAEDSLNLEADCHQFDVMLAQDSDNCVFLYEVYRDKKAFDTHLASAHFLRFSEDVGDWLIGKTISAFIPV